MFSSIPQPGFLTARFRGSKCSDFLIAHCVLVFGGRFYFFVGANKMGTSFELPGVASAMNHGPGHEFDDSFVTNGRLRADVHC